MFPEKLKKCYTKRGTIFFLVEKEEHLDDYVIKADSSEYLDPYPELTGLMLYKNETNFFLVYRTDDSTIKTCGLGKINSEEIEHYPFIFASENRECSEIIIDQFWLNYSKRLVTIIESGKEVYSELCMDMQICNQNIHNLASEKLTTVLEACETPEITQEKCHKILTLSFAHVKILKEISKHFTSIRLLEDELRDL